MNASGRRSAPQDLVATLERAKQQVTELAAENQRLEKLVTDSEQMDPAGRAIGDEACREEERWSEQIRQIEEENEELANPG